MRVFCLFAHDFEQGSDYDSALVETKFSASHSKVRIFIPE